MSNAALLRNLQPLAGGLAILFIGLMLTDGSRGQPKAEPRAVGKYLGTYSCARCHVAGPVWGAGGDDDFALMTEYTTWSLQDKHSFTFLALKGPRSVRMGKLLGIKDVAEEKACLNCHGFQPKEQDRKDGYDHRVGVGCETCHGASEKWYEEHQFPKWRLEDPAYKQSEKGLVNLRDPATCAKVCMSCHVGSAADGRVITHAMYAAGHPPLPDFELGLFRQNMPPHWREKRDVKFFKTMMLGKKPVPDADKDKVRKNYHLDTADTQQAHLVRAGGLEGLRSALELTAQRADIGSAEALPREQRELKWPELQLKLADNEGQTLESLWPQIFMGQADCMACHHELAKRSWRQVRGYSGSPGRPQVSAWPFALPGQGLGLDDDTTELHTKLAAVQAACNERPFGRPGKLNEASRSLSQWSEERIDKLSPTVDPPAMLRNLCKLRPDQYPDYPSARQIAAALWVIYGEWKPESDKDDKIRPILDTLAEEFDLQYYQKGRKDRIELVLGRVLRPDQKKLLTAEALRKLLTLSNHSLSGLPEKEQDAATAFLRAFQDRAGAVMLQEILEPKNPKDSEQFLLQMHTINERELTEALNRANMYDPWLFKERLNQIAALLPR